MKLLSLEPESSASANSAIPAKMVGRDGFEPSKSVTADLQSAPFGHSGTYPSSIVCSKRNKIYYIGCWWICQYRISMFSDYLVYLSAKSGSVTSYTQYLHSFILAAYFYCKSDTISLCSFGFRLSIKSLPKNPPADSRLFPFF